MTIGMDNVMPISVDPKSTAVLEIALKAAKSQASILITGETGVGKELIARYIHQHSKNPEGPFISVNCAAMPDNMIEAILFGYEKGAFTGAINSFMGKFEQAQNGTLFLDEISEMPIELQAKLLRVLQEKEIERLGGKKTIQINTRIISATNCELQERVNKGYFRKDLYYRLNVVALHCIPLRERIKDIIPLTNYFIKKYAKLLDRTEPTISEAAIQKLRRYDWPGNVRELDNLIHRTLILLNGDHINDQDLGSLESAHSYKSHHDNFDSQLKATEAKVIMDVLKETEGCRGIAAKKLNISPRTLRYKISKLKSVGLKVP